MECSARKNASTESNPQREGYQSNASQLNKLPMTEEFGQQNKVVFNYNPE